MKKVRVGVWGFGAMGKGIVNMLLSKKGCEIVSVVSRQESLGGKSIFEVVPELNKNNHPNVFFEPDPLKAFPKGQVDIVILSTVSFTKASFPQIKLLLENGINVISTAEEMAYPFAGEPELAKEIDELAKKNGVSVLGTGINPGMVLDLLILTLTGACESVDSIKALRVNDLSPFGTSVMEGQGVGLREEDFIEGVKSGTVVGHVGFDESINLVAKGLGWSAPKIEQTREPIISNVYRETKYAKVPAGYVAGCRHCGCGYIEGEAKISMEHPQQILPHMENVDTGDYIHIKGIPNIDMAIKPEIPGGIGTIAMCVNMIPHVINARPGLKTLLDLPIPRAIMGDMSEMIER
ncbi:MAG: 2,4-diaminopentanoate dehydrogenase [Defluviitaleaceae bacterium]|nr:2,4-diaminopentanoate dehydrogenase [Defluviitaleaceae bacterium]